MNRSSTPKARTARIAAAAALCVAVVGVAAGPGRGIATEPAFVAAGAHVDDFQLTDQDLVAHDLSYYAYAPAIVLMSHCTGTAASRAAAVELQRLAGAYRQKGVVFLMINSEAGATRAAIQAEARAQKISLPILIDERRLVGEGLALEREGEALVIDPKSMTLAWRGPADAVLGKAIDAVLAGRAPPRPGAMATGKAIAYAPRASFAAISYAGEVAPILQARCASCHLKGGIGPFALDGYEGVKKFAPMIREVVRTRRMPPWFADPHVGRFKNDNGLTTEEARTLVHWIEAGAARGTGADPLLANRGKIAPEWPAELGKPDLVIDLPAFNVPASGLVAYQNHRIDNPFRQDVWLRAVATRPGDRRVLHHIIADYEADDRQPPAAIPGNAIGSYSPGSDPQVVRPGLGAPLPRGGKLHFQTHYTTIGKPVTDRSQIGLYMLKAPPRYIQRSVVITDLSLRVPPGRANHKEVAYLVFPGDAYLYAYMPHAHYRGVHVELKARGPDGRDTLLLALPRYDFNWQRAYEPVEPVLIKGGTKLIATWVYDNSAHNRANPDPRREVTFGQQTEDEMMYLAVNYRWADETVAHPRADLEKGLGDSFVKGTLDDNLNGRLELGELARAGRAGLGALGAALRRGVSP